MQRRRSPHPDSPVKSLGIGILAAPFVIPMLPIILPLVLLYYFGTILQILFRRKS